MVEQFSQRCGGSRSSRLLPVNTVQGVSQEEEEGHPHPGPARNLLLLLVARARQQRGGREVVVVEGQQAKVSKATDEANESEKVWSNPEWA